MKSKEKSGGADTAFAGREVDKKTLIVRGLSPSVTQTDLEDLVSGVGPVQHVVLVSEKKKLGEEDVRVSKGFGFITFSLEEDAQACLTKLQGSCVKGQNIQLNFAWRRNRKYESGNAPQETSTDLEPQDVKEVKPVTGSGERKGGVRKTTPIVVVQGADLESVRTKLRGDKSVQSVEGKDGKILVTFDRYKNARMKIPFLHNVETKSGLSNASFETEVGFRERVIVRNLPFKASEQMVRKAFKHFGPIKEAHLPKKADGKARGFAFVEFFHMADANNAIANANGIKIGSRVVAIDLAVAKDKYQRLQVEAQSEGQETVSADLEASTGNTVASAVITNGNESDSIGESSAEESSDHDENNPDEDRSQAKTENGKERASKRMTSTAEELERTVFVRNLLFQTSANELRKRFSDFGAVEHCAIVKDPASGRSRGSAFVRFASISSAAAVLAHVGYNAQTGRQRAAVDGGEGALIMEGRPLLVVPAVDKSSAASLAPEGSGKGSKRSSDRRNLWLACEGRITANDSAARGLSEADLEKRRRAEKEKITKLLKNPNVFVSKLRLSVRNLPLDMDTRELQSMFARAAEATDARITQCKVVRDENRTTANGQARSKGYGFIAFDDHELALKALRLINNNPNALKTYSRARLKREATADRRLIVEFALEDSRKLLILKKIKEKSTSAHENEVKGSVGNGRRIEKRKRGRDERVYQSVKSVSSKKSRQSLDGKEKWSTGDQVMDTKSRAEIRMKSRSSQLQEAGTTSKRARKHTSSKTELPHSVGQESGQSDATKGTKRKRNVGEEAKLADHVSGGRFKKRLESQMGEKSLHASAGAEAIGRKNRVTAETVTDSFSGRPKESTTMLGSKKRVKAIGEGQEVESSGSTGKIGRDMKTRYVKKCARSESDSGMHPYPFAMDLRPMVGEAVRY